MMLNPKELAEREKQSLQIRCLIPPEESLEAEAAADSMTVEQRRGFIRLLAMGWTHTAAARIAAVPDSEVDRVVTLAYLVSNRIGMAK